jgi:NAD-dependent deacetylase
MSTLIPNDLIPALHSARRIVVLTGAGVSAESGVPTFRDALDGLWAKFHPEDLATPQAFDRDPALVSRWYDDRRCRLVTCQPNAGHVALAAWQRRLASEGRTFTLVTQNVDRLHQQAGSTDVIELHGTLRVWRCRDCASETEEFGPPFVEYPPRCPCGGAKRPGVVWFGENLPKAALLAAEKAADHCDLFLSVGTSSQVYPAAGLINIARAANAKVVEINPAETAASHLAHWSVRGTSAAVLPELVRLHP